MPVSTTYMYTINLSLSFMTLVKCFTRSLPLIWIAILSQVVVWKSIHGKELDIILTVFSFSIKIEFQASSCALVFVLLKSKDSNETNYISPFTFHHQSSLLLYHILDHLLTLNCCCCCCLMSSISMAKVFISYLLKYQLLLIILLSSKLYYSRLLFFKPYLVQYIFWPIFLFLSIFLFLCY